MTTHEHDQTHAHHSDTKAAFFGLIIGAFVIFGILRTIIALTNAHYAHEKPAAAATK
jgi:uncharacterized protein (DUF983 family)